MLTVSPPSQVAMTQNTVIRFVFQKDTPSQLYVEETEELFAHRIRACAQSPVKKNIQHLLRRVVSKYLRNLCVKMTVDRLLL